MNYLTVENLSKRYDEQALFENLTFFISEGQKVALVGKNGCGKSTLLNIISGNETAENGTVVFRKGLNVAFLPQNPEFLEHLSIRDYIYNQESETLCAIRNYEKIMARGQP
jgi:ATP-binding cassette subfamily F protein uup